MPHTCQIAPTNEGLGRNARAWFCPLERALVESGPAYQKEEWPLGAATQANTGEDWVPEPSWRSALASSPFQVRATRTNAPRGAIPHGCQVGLPGLEPGTNRLLRGVAGGIGRWREVALRLAFRHSPSSVTRSRSETFGH